MRIRLITVLALVAALASTFTPAQPAAAQGQFELDLTQQNVEGALAGGGSFVGDVTITGFGFDQGQLLANGTLTGQATPADGQTRQVSSTFVGAPVALSNAGVACDAVAVDLGSVNLPAVGAEVDPYSFNVDLSTNPTASNLICSATRLVEMAGQGQPVEDIINSVLSVVNRMLPGEVDQPQGQVTTPGGATTQP